MPLFHIHENKEILAIQYMVALIYAKRTSKHGDREKDQAPEEASLWQMPHMFWTVFIYLLLSKPLYHYFVAFLMC